MSTPSLDVTTTLNQVQAAGSLSPTSLSNLSIDADIGARIQAGLGISPDDVPAAEVVLLTMMPDDSGSIRFVGNAPAVRDGHNLVLDALAQARQRDDVLVHTRYLNGHVLYPYRQLADAVRMDASNYNPNLGTPLYDQLAVLLGTVLVKAEEFEEAGVPVRTVTLIITDGGDNDSRSHSARTIRPIVEDMWRQESHIIAAMGIDDGSTDFRQVFRDIAIPDEWILTPNNDPKSIRRAFQTFSQSAVQASQGGGGFGKTALGGFGG